MALFAAGQTVKVETSRAGGTPAGRYRVISAMPVTHGVVRYRVKGETEPFERVIEERVMHLQVL